jgi:hypothetical protein
MILSARRRAPDGFPSPRLRSAGNDTLYKKSRFRAADNCAHAGVLMYSGFRRFEMGGR